MPYTHHIVERSLQLSPKIFLGMNTFHLLLLEVLKKCKEPFVARKEKIKIPIVHCTMRSGYTMGNEFHPVVNQTASMPKCEPKKKATVGDQNFSRFYQTA
jgi:hypothetical protein